MAKVFRNEQSHTEKSTTLETVVAISLILTGCVTNNFVLELIIRHDPGIGNLMTLLQFIVVAIVSFFVYFKFSTFSLPKRKIPLSVYLFITLLFFLLSAINNQAFAYDISQPVHMIFRSSSLMTSLILGYIFFSKRYSLSHIAGVVCVTVGIILVTFAEYNRKLALNQDTKPVCDNCEPAKLPPTAASESGSLGIWVIGICMLTFALILSSLLGHVQEWSYIVYGRDWKEGLFYTHLLGIPPFLILYEDLIKHVNICNASPPILLFNDFIMASGLNITKLGALLASLQIPILWVYLTLNVLTQIICIFGVYILTGSAGTLTTTLALTVRKFLSLIISILYFQNPFTPEHWSGSILVFLGGVVYIFGSMGSTRSVPIKQKSQ